MTFSFSLSSSSSSSSSESDSKPEWLDLIICFSTDVTASPGLIQSSTGLISYNKK